MSGLLFWVVVGLLFWVLTVRPEDMS